MTGLNQRFAENVCYPLRRGQLLCKLSPCVCATCLDPPHPKVEEICADMALAEYLTTKNGPLALGGQTSASGSSPITIHYTIDLTDVPDDAIICAAIASYGMVGYPPYSVDDDGGVTTTSPFQIRWKRSLIVALNAAWKIDGTREDAFPIRATGSWTFPPPATTFSVTSVVVSWTEPGYP